MKLFKYEPKYLLILCILAALTLIAFLHSAKYPFTNYDDNRLITENKIIRELSFENAKTWLSESYDNLYQPLTLASWALDYKTGQYEPWIFHLHNYFLHWINAFLVFLVLFKLCQNFNIALFTSIIFAVHPIQVESVVWMSERKNLLLGFYFLLALYQYILYCKKSKTLHLLLSIFFILISNLAKSQGILFFLIALYIDYLHKRPLLQRKIWFEKIPFLAIAILFAYLTVQNIDLKSPYLDGINISFTARIMYGLFAFYKYFAVLLYPPALSAFYPYTLNSGHIPFYSGIAGIGFAILFVFLLYKSSKKPMLLFGLVIFSCLLLPMLNFIKYIPIFYMSNHYAYISTMGFGIICAFFIDNYISKRHFKYLAVSILTSVLITFTIIRATNWKSASILWESVLNKYPSDPWVLNMKGLSLAGEGKTYAALETYTKAINIDKNRYAVYYNRANSFRALNRIPEAILDYSKAISLQPLFEKAFVNRGASWLIAGDTTKALLDFNHAIKLNPSYAGAFYNRGFLYLKNRNFEAAQKDFEQTLKIDNYFYDAHFQLAMIKIGNRETEEAIYHLNQVIKLKPDYAPSYFFRAECYFKNGNLNSACEDWKKSESLGFKHAAEKLKRHCY